MDLHIDSDNYLQLMEQQDALKKLPREALIAHLSLQGWVPVAGVREALQRGCDRVNIIERERGLSAAFYTHPHEIARIEQPWPESTPRLLMLALRIVEQEFKCRT